MSGKTTENPKKTTNPANTCTDKTSSADDALSNVSKELERKTKEANDYLETLKRLQADFENFIKRTEKERKEITAAASERIVSKLLPVLDELHCSVEAVKKQGINEAFAKGIELIYRNFQRILQEEGVQPIDCLGQKADPFLHDVVLAEKNDSVDDGVIIAEIQKGYKMNGKVVRYSKVKIARR
ncbi:MAG: nucleotide exchange factor GrpE [Candidatus Woesearchaeota archaeon]